MTTKPIRKENDSKKSDDEEENQVEKPLLDSIPKTEVEQPEKEMPLFKKKSAAGDAAAGGGDSSMFDVTLEQLNEIMELKGKDLMEKVNSTDFNGVKGILEKLKVDANKGLDSNNQQDLDQRRTAYGKNEIPPKPMKTFLRLCWEALHDMLLVILLVCAIVSIGLSFYKGPQQAGASKDEPNLEWIEGVAILAAVLVVVFVTAFNDWRKERQFRGLQNKIEKDQQTSVVRDNRVQQIPVSELVVGDLCFIKYGDLLPADGLIVQSSDLKIDESSITGETDLVKKSEDEDAGLLSGTHVMEGSGRMIVLGVGLNSQVGRIMSLLGATGDDAKKDQKKGKKKGKKKDSKDKKKKGKKSKPQSSTKVSPDKSKADENEDYPQMIHTENETKQHPRTRRLPPLQQSNNNEQEMKPTKKVNNNQQKKTADDTPNNNQQSKKKSTSSESSTDEPEKKAKNSENRNAEQKRKKLTKSKPIDEQEKKKSSSSESSDEDQKKKSTSNENIADKEKKNLTKTKSKDSQSEKKSDKTGSSDEEQEKKSEQKQGTNPQTTSSSNETKLSDGDQKDSEKKEDSEKKPAGLAALAEDAEGGGREGNDGESKDTKHKSVLQEKLTKLALHIGYIGMTAAVLTLICLIIRFCITTYVLKKQGQPGDASYLISFLIQAVIQAITVIVVSVPEGLPLAVTLALAYAVRKMMTDNNLVRHLDACETMGNASTICSDKTGTLTTNRMTVVQCYITGKYHDKLPKGEELNKDVLPLLFESVTVNANYTTKIEEAKQDEGGLPKQIGNKTECALLGLVQKWGGSYDEIRKQIPQENLVKVYTFNSARKMMSTIIQRDEGYRLYTKGASEMVLTKCKSILAEDNKPKDLNDEEKKKITHDIIEKMANDGLRTICIAYKDIGKEKQNWDDDEKIINDLICIAIVGIEDPVRDEVPEAIEKCQKAGVIVRMVTGDNIMTARSIATKCGIIKPEDDFLVLEGKEFNKKIRDSSGKISQKKLDEIWPKLRVLARSSPTDKYNLVNGIVESRATAHREVVAVTGDGTNDGPALKRADVGFAMGIQGTDVAKQASDIILTDDNFSSIVKAMMWGRNVYDCIAKFLQFQLTANLSAGILSVVCAAAISSVPLRAVQMLWINLVMDTLASLALATEPPTEELLKRKPYGRTKSIISPLMLRNIIGQALYQLAVMFIILYTGQYFLGVNSTVAKIQDDPHLGRELSPQFTMVFNAFVLMTLFNEINSRKLHGERNVFKGIFANPFFYCIWLGCFVAQILIVTFGDKVFSCARLDIKQWAWCLLFGIGSLIWQQILLFIPIKPFGRCFSGIYHVCCPCIYKKQKKKRAEKEGNGYQKPDGKTKKKRSSKTSDNDEDIDDTVGNDIFPKYSTIVQLTNATVVVEPPPIFARYMLRKSVDRLNTEFRVINEFRSRLEKVKDKRYSETMENRRNSQDNDLDE